MKKITFKSIFFFGFTLFSLCLTAQTAPDEDTNPDLTCPASGEFENNSTREVDIPSPDNDGTVDDRTCYADYYETSAYGETWGAYNITFNSNHWDSPGTLQPRIERSFARSRETGVGSYARFTGTLRILEAGNTVQFNTTGSYFMQAKGKHTGGGGSADPAICLYNARPVYGDDGNGNQVQVSYNIWREQINYRGGSGSAGRTEVFLKNVAKDEIIDIELKVGFRQDPNDPDLKIHYADAVIGGDLFEWNIPEPERGTESGIRYGVYRVKGGRAQMRWANTTYEKVEIVDPGDEIPEDIYTLKNVATGKYLMASGTTIIASDSGEGLDKEWKLVPAEVPGFNYYNIDSQGPQKIIRFKGGSSTPELVCTAFSAPNDDPDKIWTIIENTDGTFSFGTGNQSRYLYHAADNTMTHSANLDDRSKWIVESTTLSVDDRDLKTASIKIYPNPARDEFTIAFQNINNIKHVEIYSILGKRVYQSTPKSSVLEVQSSAFKTGVYLVKAFSDDNKVYHTKLVIK